MQVDALAERKRRGSGTGIRDIVRAAGLTAALIAATVLSLEVAFVHGKVSAVCLPAGLSIAALTLWGSRFWPAVLLGSAAADLLIAGSPLAVAIGSAAGDTLGAVLGALILHRFGVRGEVTRARDAVAILAVAAVAPLPSASLGALSVTLGGFATWDLYSWVWLAWWLGDSIGILLVLPLLLAWVGERSAAKYPSRPVEFAAALMLTAALLGFQHVGGGTLSMLGVPHLPPGFLLFPAALWAMLRLRPRRTMLVLAGSASLAVAHNIAHLGDEAIGPFLSLLMELFSIEGGFLLLLGALAERDLARFAAHDSAAQLGATFEQAVVGIGHLAPSGHWLRINEKLARMLGYRRDQLVGRHWSEVTHPADQPFWDELTGTLTDGERDSYQAEKRWLRQEGTPQWAQVTASVVRDEDGALRNISIVCLDMSERERAEAERKAREAAESANRAKSEFLANMSHELRSPLNTILGFARLVLRNGGLRNEAKRDVEIIVRSGEHLLNQINQVLALSQIEAGRTTLNESRFDLQALLRELHEMFARRAEERGLELVIDDAQAPRFIQADQAKLRQILINLLSNAVKFTRAGRVRLQAGAHLEHLAPGHVPVWRLRLTVSDTGPGIAREELAQLGGRFVQAAAGRQAGEGSGLGLSISRSFVSLMGGELEIESRPGDGTTVWFEIPVQEAGDQAAPAAGRRRRALGLEPGQPPRRILVVDHIPEARELLVRVLRPLGFEVEEAAGGLDAVVLAERWQPDLVWMNLAMPGLDGTEAARRIKANAAHPPTIIALTAQALMAERPASSTDGCDDVLRKPFEEHDLLSLLEKHLGVRFTYEAVEPATGHGSPVLDSAALNALPAAAREALARAVIHLDTGAVDLWIESVRRIHPEVAEGVADLAEGFQYERILSWIQPESSPGASPADRQ